MFESLAFVLLVALILDWYFGDPEIIWSRLPHPVVIFGKAVSLLDKRFNDENHSDERRYKTGALGICVLIIGSILGGLGMEYLLGLLWHFEFLIEAVIVFTLLAQRSLADHVGAVSLGLSQKGIEGGRSAVAMIVGRDPQLLDRSGVCRAAIESLAENFSDGVIAPAFWYLIFGLPGLFAYKMINTADSMIGYRSEKYLYFGRVSAQIDDLANWLPARFSASLIAIGSVFSTGVSDGIYSIQTAFRDAGLHRSPNAGWPEAAMAGALKIALGGPRVYANESVEQAYLNSSGKRDLDAADIDNAIKVFWFGCFTFWGVVAGLSMFGL